MRKTVLTILAFLMLALSACVSTSPATTVATQGTSATPATTVVTQGESATTALNAAYENAVSVEMQLLLGTLSLAGDLAVTDEQASTLLPLWNELRTISMSMGPGQGTPGQSQADATP